MSSFCVEWLLVSLSRIWNMVADWSRVGTLHNVRTQEYGWGYIQPLHNGTSDCVCYILMNPTINGLPPNESCEATTSLTKSYQDMIMSRLQALENQTMDQLVREKRALQKGEVVETC
ncbi:hypothetical protein PF008_g3435 [Phytophthora fragariae]|uniref:ELMO domain-containing protein n=1 Tax=Phytophthora fragariae TaxID=53985 RepID=A0A6G0SE59_9STRA|nr:hypothetical protein PF008_g3435 [Phytophthora fragariae]